MTDFKPFARIFDTPHGQLLATIDYDEDADTNVVTLRSAEVAGIMLSMRLSGWEANSETGAQLALDSIDQQGAESHARSMHDMILSLAKDEA